MYLIVLLACFFGSALIEYLICDNTDFDGADTAYRNTPYVVAAVVFLLILVKRPWRDPGGWEVFFPWLPLLYFLLPAAIAAGAWAGKRYYSHRKSSKPNDTDHSK